MKTQTNVEKFYQWVQRINSKHLADNARMVAAFHIVATHKINKYEGRS